MPRIKIFDSHVHIIDRRFPLYANSGYLPEPFTIADYRDYVRELELIGGAVVSGSFQKFDQSYLVAALKELGKNFFGVTQLKENTSDEEILRLHQFGVRAIRFNLRRIGMTDIPTLKSFANRVYDLAGWHTELYVDSSKLPDLEHHLISLPAVSIDHMGLSKEGLTCLQRLVEHGTKVKASGFGRLNFPPQTAIKSLYTN